MQVPEAASATAGFLSAEVHTLQEAIALLRLAKSRSSNWTATGSPHLVPVPNKAHMFIRLVVIDLAKQQVSTLHVVDLAGTQNLSSHGANEQQHLDKLITNRHLLSFSKVVTELSRMSVTSGTSGIVAAFSGLDLCKTDVSDCHSVTSTGFRSSFSTFLFSFHSYSLQ